MPPLPEENDSIMQISNKEVRACKQECLLYALIDTNFRHFVERDSGKRYYTMKYSDKGDLQFCFYKSHYPKEEHIHVHGRLSDLGLPFTPSLQMKTNKPASHNHTVSPCVVYKSPAAVEVIARIKSWIQECDSKHSNCVIQHTQQTSLPTRLIRLDEDSIGTVRLDSPTSHVRFAALSYCWGTSKQSSTTKDNLPFRKQQIIVSELSQTLQDAITTARALGLHYIWIDALCIVQDDEHDWAVESSRMADIYSGAYIVLAATRASDCAEGFLQPRQNLTETMQLPNTVVEVSARRVTTHDCWSKIGVDNQPLYQRAWAMQERELARRIIHFLPDEILWYCQTTTYCECGSSPLRASSRISSFTAFSELLAKKDCTDDQPTFGVAWACLIQDYHRLQLTHVTDKLPALSGLALRVEPLNPGRYVAGLWEKDIAYQLAWWSIHDGQRTGLDGPSFSWVAATNPIQWPRLEKKRFVSRCRLIATGGTPSTANPYGSIPDCSITVRARALRGKQLYQFITKERSRWDNKTEQPYLNRMDKLGARDLAAILADETVYPEGETSPPSRDSVLCMELFQAEDSLGPSLTDINALLLHSDDNGRTYTRIGLLRDFDRSWYDGVAEQDVVIR
jgi:hypothetical protein